MELPTIAAPGVGERADAVADAACHLYDTAVHGGGAAGPPRTPPRPSRPPRTPSRTSTRARRSSSHRSTRPSPTCGAGSASRPPTR
ncbi:hypothetical protein ACU4GG_37495 [Streptomyces nojiriensis]